MRGTGFILASAAAAAIFATAVAGCKGSYTAPPLPNPCPSAAPTLAAGIVTEYGSGLTANATPFDITAGPDGNLWFTEFTANKVARVTPAGVITEFAVAGGAAPEDIVKGPPGNNAVWFVENGTSEIGTISTAGSLTEYPLPSGAGPSGLALDQSGDLWFGEFNTNTVARINTSGSVTAYVDSTYPGGQPDAVAIAPDNSVWFLDAGTSAVGHLTFPGGSPSFVEYALSSGSAPEFITVGSDGNLWLTEGVGRIAKVIPSTGAVTEYVVPTQTNPCLPDGSLPFGIALSPIDNDVWFGEADAGQIGRITPGGVITEYGIPNAGTTAVGVAAGPDGNVWFTDTQIDGNLPAGAIGTNQVGKINISAIPASAGRHPFGMHVQTSHWHQLPIHRRSLRN